MKVAIVGFAAEDYDILCEKMEEVIAQYALFNVIGTFGSIGEKWAREFGAPFLPMFAEQYKSLNDFIDAIAVEADFLVMNYSEAPGQHRLVMKMRGAGKRGIVVQSSQWQ